MHLHSTRYPKTVKSCFQKEVFTTGVVVVVVVLCVCIRFVFSNRTLTSTQRHKLPNSYIRKKEEREREKNELGRG